MPEAKKKLATKGKEETFVRSIGFLGIPGGGVAGAVDVKNGKIVRIRPLHYEWKYNWEKMNPWKVSRNGKTFWTEQEIITRAFFTGI